MHTRTLHGSLALRSSHALVALSVVSNNDNDNVIVSTALRLRDGVNWRLLLQHRAEP